MKDIVIKGRAIRTELIVAAACLLAAFSLNVYAVIHYSRPLTELAGSLGYVVVVAAALYPLYSANGAPALARFIYYGFQGYVHD